MPRSRRREETDERDGGDLFPSDQCLMDDNRMTRACEEEHVWMYSRFHSVFCLVSIPSFLRLLQYAGDGIAP